MKSRYPLFLPSKLWEVWMFVQHLSLKSCQDLMDRFRWVGIAVLSPHLCYELRKLVVQSRYIWVFKQIHRTRIVLCFLFLSALHSVNTHQAHMVFFLVLAGTKPLDNFHLFISCWWLKSCFYRHFSAFLVERQPKIFNFLSVLGHHCHFLLPHHVWHYYVIVVAIVQVSHTMPTVGIYLRPRAYWLLLSVFMKNPW